MADHILQTGFFDVGAGHTLRWQLWGKKNGIPVVCLHGGPGAGFQDSHKSVFDPERHTVLLFDQRGCGKSTPYGSTEHNTTPDLVADTCKLMDHVGFKTAHIAGGSWGSALSLIFAIAHPERVRSLLIWSVYLIRPFENAWVNEGGPRNLFPDEYKRFISNVPADVPKDSVSIMKFYRDKIFSDDEAVAAKYAFEWTLWEECLITITYNPDTLEAEVREDPNAVSIARLELYYFLNGCFVPENHILDSVGRIRHLRCRVVQGRFDMCTPAVSAHDLRDAYGEQLELKVVNSGHLRSDPEMNVALQKAASSFE
ncbi:hypothetical protein PRZ48_013626 [Zasmidium cellare]|uniref:Proline iminopeptidase n=1 Tax=Zasmidium cellare TaxID=395010 RepID=A0ABR0E271_ZASCE|nr:hypothetical protein PRZ48_013626 [Zasmidium cellare]